MRILLEPGPEQIGDAHDARVGALKLTLLRSADETAHESEQPRVRQSPEREERNAGQEAGARLRQRDNHEARDAEGEPHHQCGALADPRGHRPDHNSLHDDRRHTDASHGQADGPLVPAVPVEHVKDGDARQDGMGEIAEEADPGKPEQFCVRAQQHERAERIGLAPVEWRALRARQ
jgi:hypothetical protein